MARIATDPSHTEHQERMLAALALWRDITNVDPEASSFRMGEWELKDTYDRLQEAIDLDPSGVTATMLLGAFHDHLLTSRTVSYERLLRDPEAVQRILEPSRRLLALLDHPAVQRAHDAFITSVRLALEQYGAAERDDIQALLNNPNRMAILRRDALRSMATLRLDQFLDGSPEPEGTKPVYNHTVHQWWNINSLLNACTRIPSGVTLNLIRHPDEYQSYFAFTVRNGGNLFVLSDLPNHTHPLQGYMTRRPDRRLSERADRHWFPYDLLGMAYDQTSGECYIRAREQRALAAYQTQSLPLKSVAELDSFEVVWLALMFDLLVDHFWRQGYKAPALSYTAEMLKSGTVLLEAAKASNLPVPNYAPVGLPPVTRDAVSVAQASETAIGTTGQQDNRWMEERYGHRVTEESLNLVDAPEALLAVEHQTGEITDLTPAKLGGISAWDRQDLLKGRVSLEAFNSATFGSREQLENDRLFIARVNYARQIDRFAADEYAQRKAEVMDWYIERVKTNLDALLAWAGNEELSVDHGKHPTFASFHTKAGRVRSRECNSRSRRVEYQIMSRHWLTEKSVPRTAGPTFGRTDERNAFRCAVTDARASLIVLFCPTNAAELAWLAGCATHDLPDVLQHWSLFEPYNGNSILSRVDPMLWMAKNPWKELNLRVQLPLSKRGLAHCEKMARLPDVPNLITPAARKAVSGAGD